MTSKARATFFFKSEEDVKLRLAAMMNNGGTPDHTMTNEHPMMPMNAGSGCHLDLNSLEMYSGSSRLRIFSLASRSSPALNLRKARHSQMYTHATDPV